MKGVVDNAAQGDADALIEINEELEAQSASERIAWALRHLPGTHVL